MGSTKNFDLKMTSNGDSRYTIFREKKNGYNLHYLNNNQYLIPIVDHFKVKFYDKIVYITY